MRMRRYLAAECLVLAVMMAGTGLVVRGLVRIALAERARPAPLALSGAFATPAERDLGFVPSPATAQDSAGTFLGIEDDSLIERMRREPIVRMRLNKGGSSLSFRVDFADGSRAAFKPAQTNLQTIPRKEVAAYRLNRLLGLSAVAPATPRMLGREEIFSHLQGDAALVLPRIRAETVFDPRGNTAGVMMYWIPAIRDSGLDTPEGVAESTQWLTVTRPIPFHRRALAAQLSDMLVFDFLIANPDRGSGGNMMTNEDGSRLYFMDNTMSFFIEPEGNERVRAALHRAQRFSRRLYEALGRISETTLTQVLAQASEGEYEILTQPEIRAVVSRRDYVRRYIDGLVAAHGAPEVLYFP
ncbi:MAG: hypothetical protein JXP73_02785 [Deltaproteobacteria bacterium]|nr:hypothetical protein [Deltaproteobacteria bacterium]